MIVAEQKRKENVAEYILYMWQIEDTIRALDFDLTRITEYVHATLVPRARRCHEG